MYTIQSLWTMAREGLDVTAVLFNNRSYAILNLELSGSARGQRPQGQVAARPHRPDLDFVSISSGLGVPAERAESGEDFTVKLERAFAEPGPHLIEVVIPSLF